MLLNFGPNIPHIIRTNWLRVDINYPRGTRWATLVVVVDKISKHPSNLVGPTRGQLISQMPPSGFMSFKIKWPTNLITNLLKRAKRNSPFWQGPHVINLWTIWVFVNCFGSLLLLSCRKKCSGFCFDVFCFYWPIFWLNFLFIHYWTLGRFFFSFVLWKLLGN